MQKMSQTSDDSMFASGGGSWGGGSIQSAACARAGRRDRPMDDRLLPRHAERKMCPKSNNRVEEKCERIISVTWGLSTRNPNTNVTRRHQREPGMRARPSVGSFTPCMSVVEFMVRGMSVVVYMYIHDIVYCTMYM